MYVALRCKNKLQFVNGSLPQLAEDDQNYFDWDRCNTMIISWIVNSLDPEIAHSVMWIDIAAKIWLKNRYYQGDIFRISDLQEDLYVLRQGDSTVTVYYNKFKKLWLELENFRPLPTCSCTIKCACNGYSKMQEYRETDYVLRFLKGLNEQYFSVRSQIMLMAPLPNVGRVFSMVLQQEKQFYTPGDDSKFIGTVSGLGRGDNKGRGTRGGRTGSGKGRGTKVCTYCNKIGHMVDTCYRKHGFPPHLQKPAAKC